MKTKLRIMALALIAGGTMFARTQVSIGIGVGAPAAAYCPPPVYQPYAPRFVEPRNNRDYRVHDRDRDRGHDRDRDDRGFRR